MVHKIRLFAMLREQAGSGMVDVEAPDGATVAELVSNLADQHESLRPLIGSTSLVMAVNREYAEAGTRVREGDELALIPPVSGGAA